MGIIILILTACLFYETDCHIMVVPTDTEVRVNQSTYLNCSTSIISQEVAWYRYRVGDPYNKLDVYDAEVIDKSYRDRFYIDRDKTKGVYNLIIKRVLEEDAGKYECQDDGGIGDKRSAELVVLGKKGPVCQSNIPAEGIVGPNDCGFEPATLQLSCGVKFHGNNHPQLEWSMEQGGKEGKKFPQSCSSCNSTVDEAKCNLTVKAELQMNGSSIVCKTTTGSTSHRCSVDNVKVLYAFNNNTGTEKTLNDKVACVANSSQSCTYRWKWFEWKYDIEVATDSELTAEREGWHRCEAECQFGNKMCPIVAMVIHVSSPANEGAGQDSKTAVAVLSTVVAFQTLFIFIILGRLIIYPILRKRFHRPTGDVDRSGDPHRQSESAMLRDEPIQLPAGEPAEMYEFEKRNTSSRPTQPSDLQ